MKIPQEKLETAYNENKRYYIVRGRVFSVFYSQNAGFYTLPGAILDTKERGFFTAPEVNRIAGTKILIEDGLF